MSENDFIQNYLKPLGSTLDRRFTLHLPAIDNLELSGEFIFQASKDSTASTQIMTKYTSAKEDLRLIEVYKNTENKVSGTFVRLVGTLSIVKKGFHFLFLDAAVTNISLTTAEKEPITTRIAVHVPQSEPHAREELFVALSSRASDVGSSSRELNVDSMPEFWGPIWLAESKKLDLELISKLRDVATATYLEQCASPENEVGTSDLRSVQDHMMMSAARREHLLFAKMGLTVPCEAQAAFFGLMTGVGEL